MDNKHIFSRNLRRIMEDRGVSRKDIASVLGISYFTVTDWVNGKKFPRMDKVELLANYFGILKSDLIEDNKGEIPLRTISVTEDEQKLLELFRLVPENQQQMVLQINNRNNSKSFVTKFITTTVIF